MILYCSDPAHDDGGELDLHGLGYGDGWRVSGPLRARVDRIAEAARGAASRDRTEPPAEPGAVIVNPYIQVEGVRPEFLLYEDPLGGRHDRLTIRCSCGLQFTSLASNWDRFATACEAGGVDRLDLRTAISAYGRHAGER